MNCSRVHPAAAVQSRLDTWLAARLNTRLEPLLALIRAAEARAGSATALPGQARGLAHQLAENFGALERAPLALPEKLGPILRALKPFGVWFGRRTIYLPKLLRPDAAGLLALLWGVWTRQNTFAGAARARPYLLSRMPANRANFSMPRGFRRDRPAAPSASTCWSGWRQSWRKAAISGADAADPLPKTGIPAGSRRMTKPERRAGAPWAGGWSTSPMADNVRLAHTERRSRAEAACRAETAAKRSRPLRAYANWSRKMNEATTHRQMAVACTLLPHPGPGAGRGQCRAEVRLNGIRVEKPGQTHQTRRYPDPGHGAARLWRCGWWHWPNGGAPRREARLLYEIVAD